MTLWRGYLNIVGIIYKENKLSSRVKLLVMGERTHIRAESMKKHERKHNEEQTYESTSKEACCVLLSSHAWSFTVYPAVALRYTNLLFKTLF